MDEILEIYTLGGLQFRRGRDSSIAFRTTKNAALAVYMACTGQAHPRELLAEMFWPDRTLDAARSNLRAALTDLRKQVGSAVNVTRNSVKLPAGHTCWVDAVALDEGLSRFDEVRKELGLTPVGRSLLQESLAIYQGDFLGGFYVNSPDFENWAWMERDRLRNRVMSAFDILIDYHTLNAEYAVGLARASELLQIDPLREKTIRYLMQLHVRSGDRASALYQYDSWRSKLSEELGLEPEAKTIGLYEDIKAGRLSLPAAITVLGPSNTGIGDVRLPHPPTPFVGRENELVALITLVLSSESRLITILGPGGIGKTRLAIAVAEAVSAAEQSTPHFADGIVFVSLEAASTPGATLTTLATTIGLQASTSQEHLLDYLKSEQMLIILDGFDPGLNGVSLINDLMVTTSALCLLITAREPVGIYGEQQYLISGLSLSAGSKITHVEQALVEVPAVRLLVQSARRSNPRFTLQGHELDTAIDLCHALDGIPLAIELAASWTRFMPVAEILSAIQRSIDFLETDLRDIPERHRSMRGVFDSVWERLPREEQRIFAELAVFVDGFSRGAAQEVTGCSVRVLASLVSKSLVTYDFEVDRYHIHELLRQFCAEKRAGSDGWDFAARDHHSTFYCHWAHEQESLLVGARQHEVLAVLEREAANVMAAWYWAVKQHDAARLLQACVTIARWSDVFGRYDDGVAAFGAAIEWLQNVTQPTSAQRYLLAMALHWHALIGRRLHKPNDILRQSFLRAKEIFEDFPSEKYNPHCQKAYTLMQLVYVSPPHQARQLQEQSLALFRETGDRLGEILALWAIGTVALQANDFAAAEQEFAQCMALCQSSDVGESTIVHSADALIWTLFAQNKFAEAERLTRDLQANYQRPGQPILTAQHGFAAASLLVHQGHFSEASALAEESLSILEQRKLRHLIIPRLLLQAQCKLHLGQYEDAQMGAEAVLRLEKSPENNIGRSQALNILSQLALVQGDLALARQLVDHKMTFPFYYTRYRYEAINLAVGAYALLALQQVSPARQHIEKALRIAVEAYDYYVLIQILPSLALLFAINGDFEAAVELYSLATQQPFVGKSVWFDEVVGSRIRAAASSNLPASRIKSAQTRGRHLDLWQTSASALDELARS